MCTYLCVLLTQTSFHAIMAHEEYESLLTGNLIFQVIATSEKADQLIVSEMSNASK